MESLEKWWGLLEGFDLKVVCTLCSVKVNEITYILQPSTNHNCSKDLVLAQAKNTDKWRPISRRPSYPNPGRYKVCWFFSEGSGCTRHKRQCTYPRSLEEATVWNFQKRYRVDHSTLIRLVTDNKGDAKFEKEDTAASRLTDHLSTYNLKAVCSICSVKEGEITYRCEGVMHQCCRDILLAQVKGTSKWRHISQRPSRNVRHYQLCRYFVEGYGCTEHHQLCTFARSHEEAAVWNFEQHEGIDHNTLIRLVSESESDGVNQEQEAKNLFTEFSGDFQELCKDCFNECPPKLTGKKWNNTCTEEASHTWDPVLVHHVSNSQGKNIYNEIRLLPKNTQLEYCIHVLQGRSCWHKPTQCQSAHSEVEMAVWRAESTGLFVRPELLLLSKKNQANPRLQVEIYCKACFLVLSSQESFYRHCASLEHARMISEDTAIEWKHRPPPHGHRAQFWLCDRSDTCEYGDNCVKAHSVEELADWLMQTKEEREIRQNIETQGLMSYTDSLLEEYRHSGNEVHIISEQVDDVSVTCDEDLNIQTEEKFKWDFQIKTERRLAHVALLKQEPGASFSIGEDSSEACLYSRGERFLNKDTMAYDITVIFKSNNPGLYEQWLVFDFDMRPVLLQKLRVRNGKQTLTKNKVEKIQPSSQSLERWHRGNRMIIPCLDKTEAQEDLLKEYKPPQISLLYKDLYDANTPKTHENYKDTMHNFLHNEEKAHDQIVSRLHFCGNLTLSTTLDDPLFGMKIALEGELFGAITVPYTLTPDTPEGAVLKHDVQSALIAPVQSSKQSNKVYEAVILRDTTIGNKMHFKLSKTCCRELSLQSNNECEMEIQFRLNRLRFCEMHKAVDLLPDMNRVLPDLNKANVFVRRKQYEGLGLNSKQQVAMNIIVGEACEGGTEVPFLMYGPFGTGKTFTLATATKELVKKPANRVLICTHTNSSADLYVKNHFHRAVESGCYEVKPLRIKAEEASVKSTDKVTLLYCHLSEDKQSFSFPNKELLDSHRVVITTSAMARHLHDLKLPIGYFTHILIDEASQMLECEALMPLGLAGPNTRVVLAGDHMQMGPKLFSVDVHQRSDHTLLNRLFHYYQSQLSKAASKSRIIFNENYRSTKEIVEFVSTHFYVGKSDAIKAVGNVPSHPSGHSLKFYHVRGECKLDTTSMSWFNVEEVAKVVEIVEDLLKDWPSSWGHPDPSSVCVLSEGCQVIQIRNLLRNKCLGRVNVENIANVQGKQFRAIVMTTVQTRDSLDSCDSSGLEFFSDARVLNTAMTRAQSRIVVVGDAAGLCYFGNCSRTWKCFLDHCLSNNSVEPKHITKEYIDDDLKEISRFQRSEYQDKSSQSETSSTEDNMDLILQQLTEECDQLSDDQSECEFFVKEEKLCSITETDKDSLLELCEKSPGIFKRGELHMEKFNAGYIMPYDNPKERIEIKGRKNLGKSFPGDEVVIQRIDSQDQVLWKVLGITKKSSRLFVCTLEDEFYRKKRNGIFSTKTMTPINENAIKICIVMSKKKCTQIPTRKYTDGQWEIVSYQDLHENLRKNHVFLVEVIDWKDNCKFPLGNVIDILPIGTSLEEGLKILDEEYEVQPLYEYPRHVLHETCYSNNAEHSDREDLRHLITFTVDNEKSKALDDAISVADMGTLYEIGVHIADVASFVNPGDQLDQACQKRGATYYCPGKDPIYMLPKQLSINNYSLLPGQDRRVISLMVTVDKETDAIIDTILQLSIINSDQKLSYEDAEDIISELSGQELMFDAVEHCVVVAYHFAKVQRKSRLPDNWSYAQRENHRMPGKRRAHQMIEELNILFNKVVSEYLVNKQKTMDCTPLRCQEGPDPVTIKELKDEYKDLLPLSSLLRHQADQVDKVSGSEEFHVLTHMWKEIQSAAEKGEVDILVDLISADNMYPQLLPVITHFRKCLNKSFFIRSNSCAKASTGHYSMNLNFYTQASSPIRRYHDIILQRLVHSVLNDTSVQYSPQEIDILCQQSDNKCKKAEDYEKKAKMISFAVEMKKQNASKLAFVVDIAAEENSFKLSFPVEKHLFTDSLSILYRDLLLDDQPKYTPENNCVTLKWKKRVYSFEPTLSHFQLQRLQYCKPHIKVPQNTWQAIVDSIHLEDFNTTRTLIKTINPTQMDGMESLSKYAGIGLAETVRTADQTTEMEHYVDLTCKLRPSDSLRVQITSETRRGYWTPTVQLVQLNSKFEVCVEHAHDPVACFAETSEHRSKVHYRDVNEYVGIWKPLCEMESAATAVAEGESIIIEDLKLNFKQANNLEGSFDLPLKYIKEWAIECNLANSFLCIRKRGLELKAFHEVDPSDFTWVAHGVTTKVQEPPRKSQNPAKKITFYINHLPMKTTPDCIFNKNMPFTVEIIPKLTPDVRKESAVNNIVKANELVQNIALGIHIPRDASTQLVLPWQIKREKGPDGLPKLNDSQCQAVEKAMNNNFTLIQGPPGTGKTVVGVYIIYWFLRLLRNGPRPLDQKDKREVILYCGPSNKSVDVVSEYLLTFGDKLKPMRVYSQQVEMQEYPYPGSTLQLSRRTLRQELSKPELRKITLHHRIREDENPFSKEIKEFDSRICPDNGSKEDLLTDQEIEDYKNLLRKAREYELRRHDVILCTCTAASSPALTGTVSARYILIDECAMATEPQALIPLVCNQPEKIVLLGDHKQLRPIVQHERVKKMGMSMSLFERYIKVFKTRTIMLDTQYRMHEDICRFPSNTYYGGLLYTKVDCRDSVLRADLKPTPIVFGDIRGEELSLVVSTAKGNENSKANRKERALAVHIAQLLVNKGKINQQGIAILSPYNAQVSEIRKDLSEKKMDNITVTTITKSQGSEWRYIILSTVRSLPSEEIEKEPDGAWLSKHIGSVGDPNHINVAITRAKEGLCIIGNQELLNCSSAWRQLLNHYKGKSCVTEADKICVLSVAK